MKTKPIIDTVDKLTAVIVDDNPDALVSVKLLLQKYSPEVKVLAEATSASEALIALNKHKPDVIFLDIELTDDTGFNVLEQIEYENYFQVIFITAYRQYSIRAIRFNATDYLMKPVVVSELLEAITRAKTRLAEHLKAGKEDILLNASGARAIRELIIPDKKLYHNVSIFDIIRMMADGSYTVIYLKTGKKILSSNNLKYFQEILEDEGFHRTHRSDLVSLRSVHAMRKDGKKLIMQLINGEELAVATRERGKLSERLKSYGVIMSQHNEKTKKKKAETKKEGA